MKNWYQNKIEKYLVSFAKQTSEQLNRALQHLQNNGTMMIDIRLKINNVKLDNIIKDSITKDGFYGAKYSLAGEITF